MPLKPNQIAMHEIVFLLNELMEKQPGMSGLFNCGLPASEAVKAMDTIYCRPTVSGDDWITISGLISAIGLILGKEDGTAIRSVWKGEGDDHQLTGFQVGPDEGPQKPVKENDSSFKG